MIRLVSFTCFALLAFAFNSILCRAALRSNEIDPAAFTAVRLVSGAIALALIVQLSGKHTSKLKSGNWFSAFFLFAYAICFSFAYIGLTAGTGALILFGSVQLTMILYGSYAGNTLRIIEWIGLATALAGLIYLVLPGLAAPPLASSMLMAAAGIAWGFYSLRGRASTDPIGDTAGNFLLAVLMTIPVIAVYFSGIHATGRGILLSIISGAVTSGIGYAVWYAAVRDLSSFKAAVVQLAVPLITAVIGVLLLAEIAGTRLMIAGALMIGGILMTVVPHRGATR